MEEKIVVRSDLNEIVKSIGFKKISNKYGERIYCEVMLYSGKAIEFKAEQGLFNYLEAFQYAGQTDAVKSKALVEEIKKDENEKPVGKYICVLYELSNGEKYRLFTKNFLDNKVIDVYYDKFKKDNSRKTK